MSTRAKYHINGESFYIHYDGYPRGAAAYFLSAIQDYIECCQSDSLENCFEHANKDIGLNGAERLQSAEDFPDVDYQYYYKEDNNELLAIGNNAIIYQGSLYGFIEKEQPEEFRNFLIELGGSHLQAVLG